ncbi:MAG: NAD(P)-dependent oxidoreductase [Puniceicoccales bacterium]
MNFVPIAVSTYNDKNEVLNTSTYSPVRAVTDRQAPVFAFIPSEAEDFYPPQLRGKAMANFQHGIWMNPEEAPPGLLESAQVLVGAWRLRDIPLEFLKSRGGNLEYLCLLVGSPKRAITRKHLEEGLLVSNWGNICSPVVAEGALALILSRLRDTHWHHDELVKHGAWNNMSPRSVTLIGKRVAIHGFGNLARALIELIKPFKVQLSVHAPGVPVELIEAVGARPVDSLVSLAEDCDVFVEMEALRPDNYKCINRQVLSHLPKGALFVNVGRGALVDEEDLVEVARERELKVALDVYQQEPLEHDAPVLSIPDGLFMPHTSGPTKDSRHICGALGLQNLSRYYSGQKPLYVVGPEDFDRMT